MDAYGSARDGVPVRARREAAAALRHGDRRTRAQAAFILGRPHRASRWRVARNQDAERVLAGAGAPGVRRPFSRERDSSNS